MASKRIYTCDHCGKELNETHDYTETEIDCFGIYDKVDLCEKCFNEISKIVTDFCGAYARGDQNERDI